MKIEFNKTEFIALLEALCLADWLLHAHETERTAETEDFRQLEQKIFSLAREMGCGALVEFAEDLNQYFPSRAMDEGRARDFIDRFEDHTFWSELVDRLSERDLFRKFGEERALSMSFEERVQALAPLEDRYLKEFEERGLDNVSLGGGQDES